MPKSKAKDTAAHIQRVLQDDFVQEQLQTIASGLQEAYKRARQQRGRTVEDKKLYGNLRQVAISARNLTQAFWRPEPEPSHLKRRVAVIALAAAGAAALTAKLQEVEARDVGDGGSWTSTVTADDRASTAPGTPGADVLAGSAA
jgi:hypothetical protein